MADAGRKPLRRLVRHGAGAAPAAEPASERDSVAGDELAAGLAGLSLAQPTGGRSTFSEKVACRRKIADLSSEEEVGGSSDSDSSEEQAPAGDSPTAAPPERGSKPGPARRLPLTKPATGRGKFADLVANRPKAADWSSSTSSDEEGEGGSSDSEDEAPASATDSRPAVPSHRGGSKPALVRRSQPTAASRPRLQQTVSSSAGVVDLCDSPDAGEEGAALVLGEQQEFRLPGRIAGMLYPHQLAGVRWLYSLHRMQRGGILADDMGLGKTLQCAAFLAGMLRSGLIRRALVVAPVTLLAQWQKELHKCGLSDCTLELGPNVSKRARTECLEAVCSSPGVLLTTYGMVQHNAELLCRAPGSDAEDAEEERSLWDFVFLDEGHRIKNQKTVTAQQLRTLPAAVAVIISGTPIQNNLMELHSLFDFVAPGLLGDARWFRQNYEHAITQGTSSDATVRAKALAGGCARALRERYAPHFLRREKADVLGPAADGGAAEANAADEGGSASAGMSAAPQPQRLGRKNDLVVWLRLQPPQRRVYLAFLGSQAVREALNRTRSPLAALTVLKKICVHPYLLSERAANAVAAGGKRLAQRGRGSVAAEMRGFLASDGSDSESEYESASESASGSEAEAGATAEWEAEGSEADLDWADGEDAEGKLRELLRSSGAASSCKSAFLSELLRALSAAGHRTLVFSQSRVMLDILERELRGGLGLRFLRIDGTMNAAAREAAVQRFQSSDDIPVMLLTSQVGGLGLTLTAADRVVITDPAWNPAVDAQSVDRAYRIGQLRDVVVFRLICCGTVEEKIYRKQVFKGGLSRRGLEDAAPLAYFSHQELRDLFTVSEEELQASATQAQLHGLHAAERRATPALQAHLRQLVALPCYTGVSDHDLLYSQAGEEGDSEAEPGARFPSAGAQPRQAGAASGRGAGGGRAGGRGGRGHASGWGGGGDISDMLASSLRLDEGRQEGAAAARPPGADWGAEAGPARADRPAPARPIADAAELQAQRSRLAGLLATRSAGLPDGGAKLRQQIAALDARIAAAQQQPGSSAPARESGRAAVQPASGSESTGASVRPTGQQPLQKPQQPSQKPAKPQQPARPQQRAPVQQALAVAAAPHEPAAATDAPGPRQPAAQPAVGRQQPPLSSGPAGAQREPAVAGKVVAPQPTASSSQPSSQRRVLPATSATGTSSAGGSTPQTAGAVSMRALAAALDTPFPDEPAAAAPAAAQAAPPAAAQAGGGRARLAGLKQESAALKEQLRAVLAALEDPAGLSDGGKQLRKQARALDKQRQAIKENIEQLQHGGQ